MSDFVSWTVIKKIWKIELISFDDEGDSVGYLVERMLNTRSYKRCSTLKGDRTKEEFQEQTDSTQ